jgi:hypothetical protein
MEKFKRKVRMFIFVALLLLAVFGIGISGGIVIPRSTRKEEIIEINIETEKKEQEEEDCYVLFKE